MAMNLESFALFAEIVSALAVVVSLIYVGIQLKANTHEKRLESVQSITNGYREQALLYVNHEVLGNIWQKIVDGGKDEVLTDEEEFIFSNNLYSNLMLLEETYYRYKSGYIDRPFLDAKIKLVEVKILTLPQIRKRHELMIRTGIYTPDFINWLDNELKKSDLY
jgi:hypothetical protein